MQVRAYARDVEFTAEVTIDDMINQMHDNADEENPRWKIGVVDGATKLLDKVTPEMVKNYLTESAKEMIRNRLALWLKELN